MTRKHMCTEGLLGAVTVVGQGATEDRAFGWAPPGQRPLEISHRLAKAGLVLESLAQDSGVREASAVLPCLWESRDEELEL